MLDLRAPVRRFVLEWNKLGHEKRHEARIVNYADDCSHDGPAEPELPWEL